MKAVATAVVTLSTLLCWHPAARPLSSAAPLTANTWSSINLDDDGVFTVLEGPDVASRTQRRSISAVPSVLPDDVPPDARLAWFDFDGDGDLDLFAVTSTGVLQVWRNDGLGHLSSVRPKEGGHPTAQFTTVGQQFDSPGATAQKRAAAVVAVTKGLTAWTRAGPARHAVTRSAFAPHFRSGSPRSPPLSAIA